MSERAISRTDGEAIFSLEHVDFAYARDGKPQTVLRDVNFALFPAQKVGLYGPNGSGKTTFFRCVTGLVRPRRGLIRFHGRILHREKDFRELRCKVGFVLQHAEDQLFFPTVLEDVAFGPLNLGLTPDEARQRAVETLKALGLAGFEQRLTHRLSGGEKKLISLATVLAMRPEALLLDEPTNGLDNEARQRLIDILRGLSTARITISHDWDFLARTSTEYLTILDGRPTSCAPSFAHAHMHAHPLGNEPHEHGVWQT
ncbi:energy-coupling factor ABC transporter ATP-binding protein [Desulfovibrio sp. SGI.169]|uniref:energy-coupling factor ABC transporter ATP-binding protein n=1 Tax=Desulfovibrio sp. SGI.169 TaxID=3420561 RepID=UPI003D002822